MPTVSSAGTDQSVVAGRRFEGQFRRIAREIGRCRIGLVLSPGSARGLAHIGVIQVLEENGIEVDLVVGSSIGAFIGAHWAYGYNGQQMEELARELDRPWGLLKVLDPLLPPRRAFFQGRKLNRWMGKKLKGIRFSELSVPLRVVGTRLSTMEPVVFSEGDVASAVHASCAIPGIVLPVEKNGELYIDGGVSDPLPVGLLREMGIERIIAVSTVFSPTLKRECISSPNFPEASRLLFSSLGQVLNRHLNYFADGNIMDIVMRAMEGGQIHLVERDVLLADVVLQPITCDGHWYEFNNPGKYISLGREEAERQLGKIRSLLNRKDVINENVGVN